MICIIKCALHNQVSILFLVDSHDLSFKNDKWIRCGMFLSLRKNHSFIDVRLCLVLKRKYVYKDILSHWGSRRERIDLRNGFLSFCDAGDRLSQTSYRPIPFAEFRSPYLHRDELVFWICSQKRISIAKTETERRQKLWWVFGFHAN